MTFKYRKVRREVYERNSNLQIKKYRTIKEIVKIFRVGFWVLILFFIISSAIFIKLWWMYPEKLYYIIPGAISYFSPIIAEFWGEKIYIGNEREKELQEVDEQYNYYISELKSIFSANGMCNIKKRELLKKECLERLSKQEAQYNVIINGTVNLLVAVPLGALISSIVSNSSENALTPIIICVILAGIIVGVLKFIRIMNFYSEGYFKDKLLLNVLNELEYCLED